MSRHIKELFDLSGRVALVTAGTGSGCGRQIVEGLAEAGAKVVLTSRCLERAAAAASSFRAAGMAVEGEVLLPADPDSTRRLVASVTGRHGRLDILVNNAGANLLKPLEAVTPAEWESVLRINLTAAMLLSREAAPVMREAGSGVILNVASIYGVVAADPSLYGTSGLDSPLVYGVSKAGLIQMTRYLAVRWAPEIRVNCISPGGLWAAQQADFVDRYTARTPLRRMGGPDDLKGAVVFLTSDASAWVTGQNLLVDGGWTLC
jgi:NAD(P)-dependent dehydrogenase (short-subunit alcohol dehydrogenase family)